MAGRWKSYPNWLGIGAGPDLRIGTAEREGAAARLADHLTAGRLDLTEFEERTHAAYAARTARELTALFRDLPTDPGLTGRGRQRRARRPFPLPVLLVLAVLAGLALLGAVVATLPVLPLLAVALIVVNRRSRRMGYSPARRRCGRVS